MANAVELADNTGEKISAENPLPVTMTGGGSVSDAAYSDDTGAADGSVVSLLKGIYVQNAAIIALLTAIETNTSA